MNEREIKNETNKNEIKRKQSKKEKRSNLILSTHLSPYQYEIKLKIYTLFNSTPTCIIYSF